MKILEFKTKTAATACLRAVNAYHVQKIKAEGYKVDKKGIVGKVQGENAPGNKRTTSWATIEKSPGGKWYFISPKKHPLIADFDISEFECTEKDLPPEWLADAAQMG